MIDPKHPNLNIQYIQKIIEDVAAQEIIPRWKQLKDHEIQTKTGPSDLVTDADIEAERSLTAIFKQQFPGCGVIGEEAVSRGEINLQVMIQNPPDLLFVIDPVDGTWNFAHDSETFACMVACLYKGETVMSWIYDVPQKTFATAEKGKGAFYGATQLKSSAPKLRAEIEGYIGMGYLPRLIRSDIEGKIKEVNNVSTLRCAGHEYLNLARGKADFAIFSRTEPWDHLAGMLLLEEAGGVSRRYDDQPYKIKDRRQVLLNASSEVVWDDMHDLFIQPVMDKVGQPEP